MTQKYDIFISYRRLDEHGNISGRDQARLIAKQLELEGFHPFFDYSEIKDNEFDKVIIPAVENCKVFILVLTKDALNRCKNEDDWVRREIETAIKSGCKIINVTPDNAFNGWPDTLPASLYAIRNIQISDIHFGSLFEMSIKKLIDKRIQSTKRKRHIITVGVLLILLMILGILFLGKAHNPHDVILTDITDSICSPINLDLPSGTLWADRNVGAQMPADFGDLFAWGEIEPKDDYSRYTYVEQLKPSIVITKAKHDAALSQLGPDWAMPTEKQFQELLTECTWKWVQMKGNKGYKIIGKNGQQIFLPAAGCSQDTIVEFRNKCGFYWTSEHSAESRFARSLQFSNDGKRSIENGSLHKGYTIRAVYKEENRQ